jgi:tRNA (mo5U34)-methyltransferase
MPELGIFHRPSLTATGTALADALAAGTVPVPPDLQAVLVDSLAQLAANRHGDHRRWAEAVAALPRGDASAPALIPGPTVSLPGSLDPAAQAAAAELLDALHPWRKGPFRYAGVEIDTEWRSDWKWARIDAELRQLMGEQAAPRVLDVGCGNGYFGWRLLDAGAHCVVGIDPTLLFCMQHLAINRRAASDRNWVLPLRLEDLPSGADGCFDGVLSMGVLYHRRDAAAHLAELRAQLAPGGWLLLETLVVAGATIFPAANKGRYARMRNVWCVPNEHTVEEWLQEAGFSNIRCAHVGDTSTDEQRSTPWMRFESLREALDASDPGRTIEGWPRPRRAVYLARRR